MSYLNESSMAEKTALAITVIIRNQRRKSIRGQESDEIRQDTIVKLTEHLTTIELSHLGHTMQGTKAVMKSHSLIPTQVKMQQQVIQKHINICTQERLQKQGLPLSTCKEVQATLAHISKIWKWHTWQEQLAPNIHLVTTIAIQQVVMELHTYLSIVNTLIHRWEVI